MLEASIDSEFYVDDCPPLAIGLTSVSAASAYIPETKHIPM